MVLYSVFSVSSYILVLRLAWILYFIGVSGKDKIYVPATTFQTIPSFSGEQSLLFWCSGLQVRTLLDLTNNAPLSYSHKVTSSEPGAPQTLVNSRKGLGYSKKQTTTPLSATPYIIPTLTCIPLKNYLNYWLANALPLAKRTIGFSHWSIHPSPLYCPRLRLLKFEYHTYYHRLQFHSKFGIIRMYCNCIESI